MEKKGPWCLTVYCSCNVAVSHLNFTPKPNCTFLKTNMFRRKVLHSLTWRNCCEERTVLRNPEASARLSKPPAAGHSRNSVQRKLKFTLLQKCAQHNGSSSKHNATCCNKVLVIREA